MGMRSETSREEPQSNLAVEPRDQARVNERSSLLPPEDDGNNETSSLNSYNESQTTKSLWYLILLTISIGGLQIAWSACPAIRRHAERHLQAVHGQAETLNDR